MLIYRQSRICYGVFSLRLVFSVVLALFLCFVAGGYSLASQSFSCYGLYYQTRGQNAIGSGAPFVNLVFVRPGQSTAHLDLWPFLANMNSHYESANQYTWYYDKQYNFYNWPTAYIPSYSSSRSFTVPDDWTDEDVKSLVQDAYNDLSLAQQAAVKKPVCGNTTKADGTIEKWCYFTHDPVGTIKGEGIVVTGFDGVPVLSYPDANGYVKGYTSDGVGGSVPVYYSVVDGQVVSSSSVQSSSSSSLTVDPDTGLYSFSVPDYGSQLSAIITGIDDLKNKTTTIDLGDNIQVTVPVPEVTVNVPAPEVTVNPEINLPAPEVTVNVPAPEVTVNNSTDVSGIDSKLGDIKAGVEKLAGEEGVDISVVNVDEEPYTAEEQELIDVVRGWDTQIPIFGEAADMGLNVLAGKIPQMGRSLQVLSGLEIAGYSINIDWEQYAGSLLWFRAFCLLIEVVWFMYAIFKTVTQSLQV